MGIEIERKFLVDSAKWAGLSKPAGILFRQGYIINKTDRTARIRVAGDKAFITFKTGLSISRNEFEYPIPSDEGKQLLDDFAASVIEKTRYCINFKGKMWEVDVFAGSNEGLIVDEIELNSEDEVFEL